MLLNVRRFGRVNDFKQQKTIRFWLHKIVKTLVEYNYFFPFRYNSSTKKIWVFNKILTNQIIVFTCWLWSQTAWSWLKTHSLDSGCRSCNKRAHYDPLIFWCFNIINSNKQVKFIYLLNFFTYSPSMSKSTMWTRTIGRYMFISIRSLSDWCIMTASIFGSFAKGSKWKEISLYIKIRPWNKIKSNITIRSGINFVASALSLRVQIFFIVKVFLRILHWSWFVFFGQLGASIPWTPRPFNKLFELIRKACLLNLNQNNHIRPNIFSIIDKYSPTWLVSTSEETLPRLLLITVVLPLSLFYIYFFHLNY